MHNFLNGGGLNPQTSALATPLCLSVQMSVCHAPSDCFFVSRWNWAIFWPSVLHVTLYNTLFLHLSFRPPNTQNLLPKICTKSPISRLVSCCMADRPEMFGPTRGFSGMVDSMEPCKMLWGRPCCHGNEIWARRGDPVAYQLVSTLAGMKNIIYYIKKHTTHYLITV